MRPYRLVVAFTVEAESDEVARESALLSASHISGILWEMRGASRRVLLSNENGDIILDERIDS